MRVRIYYNRRQDAPLVWSWDQGTQATEERIAGFHLHSTAAVSGFDPMVPAGSSVAPAVWIELLDVIWFEVRENIAHFYGNGKL